LLKDDASAAASSIAEAAGSGDVSAVASALAFALANGALLQVHVHSNSSSSMPPHASGQVSGSEPLSCQQLATVLADTACDRPCACTFV
jgi:hypothetical protein